MPPCDLYKFLVIYEKEDEVMILDIIVLALMVIPAAIGIYRGFLKSFVRATSWVIALVCGFFLKDTVAGFLGRIP